MEYNIRCFSKCYNIMCVCPCVLLCVRFPKKRAKTENEGQTDSHSSKSVGSGGRADESDGEVGAPSKGVYHNRDRRPSSFG